MLTEKDKGKIFYYFRIYMIAIVFASFYCHTNTAIRLKGTFERLVCLKTNDTFFEVNAFVIELFNKS